jgi:hypothetical protein
VQYRTLHDKGGHFPGLDTPELLLQDIWEFFGDKKVSKTEVFESGWSA